MELALFSTRYVFIFFVFFLGLKAPGISQTSDYLQNENSDVEVWL